MRAAEPLHNVDPAERERGYPNTPRSPGRYFCAAGYLHQQRDADQGE
jgi:hypothetical protein